MRDTSGRFAPGNPGGPGRRKGSKNRLGEDFLATLCADFAEHGADVIEAVRESDPTTYLRIVAGLVPREIEASDPLRSLSDEELQSAIDLLREAVEADGE